MTNEKKEIKEEASNLLRSIYEAFKDDGMLAIYFWGSITREDFDPTISDVDSIAIIDKTMNLEKRKEIRTWLEAHFSRRMKFGLQFYGIEELNEETPYTLLATIQPPGYLLLRFNDWIHVAGKQFTRKDFKAQDMTPEEAMQHQLAQVARNIAIFQGSEPEDPRRNGKSSVYEDIIKGSLGGLYWHTVMRGNKQSLNYNTLATLLEKPLDELGLQLVDLRAKSDLNDDDIEELVPGIQAMLRLLEPLRK